MNEDSTTTTIETRRPMETDSGFLVDSRSPYGESGRPLPNESGLTAGQALTVASMNWQVVKRPLHAYVPTDEPGTRRIEGWPDGIKGWQAIVREDTGIVLGVVRDTYTPVQNVDAFSLLDELVSAGELRYVSAGVLRGGSKIWLQAKLPHVIEPVPGDVTEKYLTLVNSHDGSAALTVLITPRRLFCSNILAYVTDKHGNEGMVYLKHTRKILSRLEEARRVLGFANRSFAEFTDLARYLVRLYMNEHRLNAFLLAVIPDNPEAERNTRTENQRQLLRQLYESGAGQTHPGVRGTGWAALNAVTEFVLYHRSPRRSQEQRFESALFASGRTLTLRAVRHLRGLLASEADRSTLNAIAAGVA